MKILLLKTNQIQEVKDSYAVNFLIPKGLAVVATEAVQKQIEAKLIQKQTETAEKKTKQEELCKQLNAKTFQMRVKTNPEGNLYAALGENQIKKLFKTKIPLEIISSQTIKQVGIYHIKIKVGAYRCSVNLDVKAL